MNDESRTAPQFSVVTVSYNQGEYIRENIDSVLAQNIEGVEHIIVDGGSTDDTVPILKEYPHLVWTSEPDEGQTDALNKGFAKANGDWLIWLNSDDYLLPGALKTFNIFLSKHPDAQFVFSNFVFVDDSGGLIKKAPANFRSTRESVHKWWKHGFGFSQQGAFFRKALWQRFGPLDTSLNYSMDYDFFLKLSSEVEFLYLDAYLAAFRIQTSSKTSGGRLNFFEENVYVTKRYWRQRPGLEKWLFPLQMYMGKGKFHLMEGIHCWAVGKSKEARKHFLKIALHNPVYYLSRGHITLRLRQLLGKTLYDKVISKIPGLPPLSKIVTIEKPERL